MRLPTGKRRQQSKGGFPTRKEAEKALAKVNHEVNTGVFTPGTKVTFTSFVDNTWIPAISATIRPTTLESYKFICRKYLIPRIGSLRLDAITPAQIVNLKKVYLSIRDGMSAPADWFEPATEAATESKKQDKAATLKDKIKKNAAKEKDVPQSAEVPDDLAPAPCPDKPETTYTAAYCSTCAKRGGCPAWN